MKNPDVSVFLLHIADACEKIQKYLGDISQTEFIQSPIVQDAVLRNFEIIGEASKHVSEDFRQKYPQIEWHGMTGLRNVLIHEYFGVDLVNVWNIAKNSIPSTLDAIKKIPEYISAKESLSFHHKM